MPEKKLYIPIENLEVEACMQVGNIIIHPSKDASQVLTAMEKVLQKTRSTNAEKERKAQSTREDIATHFGKHAFAEALIHEENNGKDTFLIPKELDRTYRHIREALAVLFLFEKEVAGTATLEHQKFGLKQDLHKALTFMVALEGEKRSAQTLRWEGAIADWTFTHKAIEDFTTSKRYQFLHTLLTKEDKTDIEKRILSALLWFYEASLDFNYTNRFVKIIIALEGLFASQKEKKIFSLSQTSTLLSHAFILPHLHCQCPILKSSSARSYDKKTEEQKLPGHCSAYRDMERWYCIRNAIVHDAHYGVEKKDLASLEWWTYQFLIKTIDLTSTYHFSTITDFDDFLVKTYTDLCKKNPL